MGISSLNIVVVEDSPADRKMLESMLQEAKGVSGAVYFAETLERARDILKEKEVDVAILDLNLPDSPGEETLRNITKEFPKLAIVVNTGAYEESLGVETLSLGAQELLIKGKYNPYLLNKSLHFAIERKKLELELVEAYQKLKDMQSQLVQSEKLKVVGGLASGVAHEVKNPLATILYGITYLSEQLKGKDEKIDLVLETIKEANERANNIIKDLLDFASVTKLNRENANLNEIVEKALFLSNHLLTKHHIATHIDFARDLPLISIDKMKIEQVVINVIMNAIFAMKESGEIMIKTFPLKLIKDNPCFSNFTDDGFRVNDEAVVLEIIDNGCGIPQDVLDKIFDPFFTSRRAKGGVGLGLSVSKNIMDIHQGSIIIDNRKDQQGVIARLFFKTI